MKKPTPGVGNFIRHFMVQVAILVTKSQSLSFRMLRFKERKGEQRQQIDWIGGYPFVNGINSPVGRSTSIEPVGESEADVGEEVLDTPVEGYHFSHDLRAGRIFEALTKK